MSSCRGTPDKPALFNRERLLEWIEAEQDKNPMLGSILWGLDAMDRSERFFDPEWEEERGAGSLRAKADHARLTAEFLRGWAERLDSWAESHQERNG